MNRSGLRAAGRWELRGFETFETSGALGTFGTFGNAGTFGIFRDCAGAAAAGLLCSPAGHRARIRSIEPTCQAVAFPSALMPASKCPVSEAPSYAAPEAARILGLPVSTVRNWAFGQSGRMSSRQRARFAAVIPAADPQRRLLSFANLCELHVLSAIRREHRVSLPTVRKSLDYVSRQLGAERPLLERVFLTNGVSLFVEHASELVNVSRDGQIALRGEFERALARIERDQRGRPVRLFPFTRPRQAADHQPAVVAIDPTIAFGRPMLAQSGVKTEVIASRFNAGDEPADMAIDYGVSVQDILEALRYERRQAQAA